MEAIESSPFTVKIFVDKERNQVVFAEADKYFVDTLLSFLTLPLGTIIRLLRKQTPSVLGSLATLYEGLEKLDINLFYSDKHKYMLLHPKNSAEPQCLNLCFNIDDTEHTKYYTCGCYKMWDHGNGSWGTDPDAICHSGYQMKHVIWLHEDNRPPVDDKKGGVFVNGMAKFIISDDLSIMPMSASSCFEVLVKLGVEDVNVLEERIVGFGDKEFLSLLRLSLLSKAPLTDLFLPKHAESHRKGMFDRDAFVKSQSAEVQVDYCNKMTLKVMLRKSDNKILYAESQEDFVNYLLSLLAIPLGAVVKLLDKTPALGCISNMYTSVEQLSTERYMRSEYLKSKLLSPKPSAYFGYQIQPLGINENFQPQNTCLFYPYDSLTLGETLFLNIGGPSPHHKPLGINGFVEGPTPFLLTDDLIVMPSSPNASIRILSELKVPISDLEERVVSIGKEEALRLLEVSVTSPSALTSALGFQLLKKPKIEQ